jgi:hypothetical protein
MLAGLDAMLHGESAPAAIDYGFPHTRGKGSSCAHAKFWQRVDAAVQTARENPLYDEADVVAELRTEHPALYREAMRRIRAERDQLASRIAHAKGKGGLDAPARVAARRRARAIAHGIDTGSSEYRDDWLTGVLDDAVEQGRANAYGRGRPQTRSTSR